MEQFLSIGCCSSAFGEAARGLSMITYRHNKSRLLNGSKCSNFMILDNHWLKVEYRMDISAVADPPVAIRMRLDEMIRFRSLHRTSILVA